MGRTKTLPDVLTLAEAADYLRVPPSTVERLAPLAQIPCRRIGDEWRFSRAALDDWLRGDQGAKVFGREPSRERMIAQAGRFRDDPTLGPMLEEIFQERGRPESDRDTSPPTVLNPPTRPKRPRSPGRS